MNLVLLFVLEVTVSIDDFVSRVTIVVSDDACSLEERVPNYSVRSLAAVNLVLLFVPEVIALIDDFVWRASSVK